MIGLPASPMIRLLLALIFGFPAGDGRDQPPSEATPTTAHAAACAVDAATPPVADGLVRLVLEARPPAGVRITPETICASRDVMAARLAANGTDATLAVAADYRVLVDVSAREDVVRVGRIVTGVGLLEIVDPRGRILPEGSLITTTLGGPERVLPPTAYDAEEIDDGTYETIVSGADIQDAYVVRDQFDRFVVGFELSDEAAERFSAFTTANIGQPMAIVLDKRVVSSPTIQDTISDKGTITGPDEDEVNELVVLLNIQRAAGVLPVPFELVSVDGTPVAGTPVATGA